MSMSQENTWTIVLFLDDDTVSAVPTIWIQGDICHWPTFALPRLTTTIKKCEPLNTCWPAHKIRIFRNSTFHDYTKSRSKAKLAEDCSDLASEVESTTNKIKRNRIQTVLSSSDESIDTDSLLPTPPKMVKHRVTILGDIPLPRSLHSIPEKENTKPDLESNQNIEIDNISVMKKLENTNSKTNQNTSNETITNSNLVCSNAHCIEQDKQLTTIIDQNHMLRGIATDILTEVRAIRQDHIAKPGRLSDVSIFIKDDFLQAVNKLANLGGSNNYNFVKRTLMTLLSNDEAIKYSFYGRKDKKPFKEMGLARMVISTAEKARLAKSRRETELSIQAWLKRATDRRNAQTKKL